MSLFQNLTLGFKQGVVAPPIDQVCEVCEQLGLGAQWIWHLRQEAASDAAGSSQGLDGPRVLDAEDAAMVAIRGGTHEQAAWQDLLTGSEICLIHLARALITNPHVLILHRPFASLDEDLASRVLASLRRFISNRSLFSEQSPAALLPRTVIFSTTTLDERAVNAADDVIVVGKPSGGASLLSTTHLTAAVASDEDGTDLEPALETRTEVLRRICSAEALPTPSDSSNTSHLPPASKDGGPAPPDPRAIKPSWRLASKAAVAASKKGKLDAPMADTSVSHAEAVLKRSRTRYRGMGAPERKKRGSLDLNSLL
jgi:hypothetical protein